jgi:hypothetical protein
LALGVSSSLSSWTATITNTDNDVSTGTLVMKEAGPSADCFSNEASASCSTINKYGDNGVTATLTPGDAVTTAVTISNTGTTDAATFTVGFAACSQIPAAGAGVGDLCDYLNVDLWQGAETSGTLVGTGTPTDLVALSPISLTAAAATTAGGAGQLYTFVVTLPAGADNTYQGITASQEITWSFTN